MSELYLYDRDSVVRATGIKNRIIGIRFWTNSSRGTRAERVQNGEESRDSKARRSKCWTRVYPRNNIIPVARITENTERITGFVAFRGNWATFPTFVQFLRVFKHDRCKITREINSLQPHREQCYFTCTNYEKKNRQVNFAAFTSNLDTTTFVHRWISTIIGR